MTTESPVVLVVDDDLDVARLIGAILTDEGMQVAHMHSVTRDLLARTAGQLEPDCVLLDGTGDVDFGESWDLAEMLTARGRPIPVVMFTGHIAAVREAEANESDRSRAAGFAGVLSKPFDIDELVAVVGAAVGRSVRFDHSPEADVLRTKDLVARLDAAGATQIRHSTAREWVTFRAPSDRLAQLYWWQRLGVYLCGAYDDDTGRMLPIGEFPDRELAITCALSA